MDSLNFWGINNIRQTDNYAAFMRNSGWKVIRMSAGYLYLKKFPFFGFFLKGPRINPPIPFGQIEELRKKDRIFQMVLEPNLEKDTEGLVNKLKMFNYQANKSPISPTKSIIVSLKKDILNIFNNFSPQKRKAIKRAINNQVVIKQEKNLNNFFKINSFVSPILDFFLKKEIKRIWQSFQPENALVLTAFYQNRPLGSVLLLFTPKISYYWQARHNSLAKKLNAPSLLVYEALKISKRLGCLYFDFEGIFDKRFPLPDWQGFSKFKSGFGGEEIEYLGSFKKSRFF